MDRRQPRGSTGTDSDNLAVAKAAAWAWYQRGGSASDVKPMLEFGVSRTRRITRPTRYKLEATRVLVENTTEMSGKPNPVRRNSSLLDGYEIRSISKQLDNFHLESSKRFLESDRDDGDHHDQKFDLLSDGDDDKEMRKKKKKKKLLRGFSLSPAVICGTREDAVSSRAFGLTSKQANQVPVVKMARCRPRLKHA